MADEEVTVAVEKEPETEDNENTAEPQEGVAENAAGSDGGEDSAPAAEGQGEGQADVAVDPAAEGDAPVTEMEQVEQVGEPEDRIGSSTDQEPTDNVEESEEKIEVQEEKTDDGSEMKEGSTEEKEDNVEEKAASPLEKEDGAEESAKVAIEEGESDNVGVTEAAPDGGEETKVAEESAEGEGGAVEGDGDQPKSPVPQPSDTFAEGEQPEDGTVVVGEQLSREGSPVQTGAEDDGLAVPSEELRPISPSQVMERHELGDVLEGDEDDNAEQEEEEEEEEEEEDEEELQPEFDREQLIERYHAALAEKDQLQQQNYQLQHKLAEYFRKKKSDDSRQDFEKNVTDQEQRYLKYMATLEELHRQESNEAENYQMQIEEVKDRCQERQERVDEEKSRFIEFKKLVALNALNSRSGKPIAQKDIEQYLLSESKKEGDVVNVRLENIKLKNKLRKKEQQLKSKEELAEGLHLIDFEQLKIENQTYNEKIEERNEELLKLRKKITSTVQVLTHLKEKLQFVQAENQVQSTNLRDVETLVAQKRDVLSRTKQARDALRIDNQRLRQNSGLLGNEPLLRDFEERKDESGDLRVNLERLKMQHAELTLNCNQVRRKIEQVRGARQ